MLSAQRQHNISHGQIPMFFPNKNRQRAKMRLRQKLQGRSATTRPVMRICDSPLIFKRENSSLSHRLRKKTQAEFFTRYSARNYSTPSKSRELVETCTVYSVAYNKRLPYKTIIIPLQVIFKLFSQKARRKENHTLTVAFRFLGWPNQLVSTSYKRKWCLASIYKQ